MDSVKPIPTSKRPLVLEQRKVRRYKTVFEIPLYRERKRALDGHEGAPQPIARNLALAFGALAILFIILLIIGRELYRDDAEREATHRSREIEARKQAASEENRLFD